MAVMEAVCSGGEVDVQRLCCALFSLCNGRQNSGTGEADARSISSSCAASGAGRV